MPEGDRDDNPEVPDSLIPFDILSAETSAGEQWLAVGEQWQSMLERPGGLGQSGPKSGH